MPGRNYTLTNYRNNYQGNESDCDLGNNTNWANFELRLHNNDLGRWMSPDPAGQFHSPYISMGNNPISGFDPDGGYCLGDRAWDLAMANEDIQRTTWATFWEIGLDSWEMQGAMGRFRGSGGGGGTGAFGNPNKGLNPTESFLLLEGLVGGYQVGAYEASLTAAALNSPQGRSGMYEMKGFEYSASRGQWGRYHEGEFNMEGLYGYDPSDPGNASKYEYFIDDGYVIGEGYSSTATMSNTTYWQSMNNVLNNGNNNMPNLSYMDAAHIATVVLLADDVSGVGVLDDVLIPVIYAVAWTLDMTKFKGGKQHKRDRNFGLTDPRFWNWWHKDPNGKKAWGEDLNQGILKEVLKDWEDLGFPGGPK